MSRASVINDAFLDDLAADFAEHGQETIDKLQEADATTYPRLMARLLPVNAEPKILAAVDALLVDFAKRGPAAIHELREADPPAYLRVTAALVPLKGRYSAPSPTPDGGKDPSA
ncbi:MAG: hypothetical protein V3V86_08205 [Gammaproteobacteria bacterium]